jgi:multiple sugar transport system substrate-binding protein
MKNIFEKYWWCIILFAVILLSFILNKDDSSKYLEFSTWGTIEELESYHKLVDLYNSRNPVYPVKLIHVPGEYEQKLLILAAANNLPDVIKSFNGFIRNFYRNNLFEDLTKYVKTDPDFNINAFYPELIKMARVDSSYIAIPNVFSTLLLFYNKNHFDAENLPYPDSSWTWDHFLEVAKRLTKKNSKGEIIRWGCYIDIMKPTLLKQWGGHHLNATRDSAIFASPEAAEALQFYVDLSKKYEVTIDPIVAGFRVDEIFSSERASMVINGRWATPWFTKNMKKGSFDVCTPPHKKQHLVGLTAHFLAMSTNSKKKEAAWDFIKFLSSKEAQTIMSEDGNNIPAMQSVAESDKFLKNKNTPDIDNKAFLADMENSTEWTFDECPYVNPTFMQRAFDKVRDEVVLKQRTAYEALKEYDEKLNRMIAAEKYRRTPKKFLGSGLFYICIFFITIATIGLSRRKKSSNNPPPSDKT